MSQELTVEDFYWDEFFWVAELQLSSLRGEHPRLGPYDGQHAYLRGTGLIKLTFAPEGRDDAPLSTTELKLAQWFLDNEAKVIEASLEGIYSIYDSEQEKYGYTGEEKSEYMPDIHHLDDIRKVVNLHSVNIHPISKNSCPYIGLEFACTWDDEHGTGVLLNGSRIVEVGGADTAILLWIAEQDAEKSSKLTLLPLASLAPWRF